MPLSVAIFAIDKHRRSRVLCNAFAAGVAANRDQVIRRTEDSFIVPIGDVAVFYGMAGRLPEIMRSYLAAGRHAIYIDLGYWGRMLNGRLSGYHKVVVDGRHPTAYFQARRHDASRAAFFGLKPKPWRAGGRHILLAGMSDKCSGTEGFAPEQWEREAIAAIRQHTDRPIVYRPKPSWANAPPIEGTEFSPADQPLEDVLADCHAVVTHHSNTAVDALLEGVPAFCWEGVATPLALQDLGLIEHPRRDGDREQWAADIAWCQWSVEEIARGLPWQHLKREGLL